MQETDKTDQLIQILYVVFIQVIIRKNRFNTASNWSLYRSGHVYLAIDKKMADDITDIVSTVPKMPEILPRKFDRYAKLGEEIKYLLMT